MIDMDFLKKFQQTCKEIEETLPKRVRVEEKLFNIHKRSLPVGIDKVIIVGVTKKEGDKLLENSLVSRVYYDSDNDSKTLIYYDLIPQNATPKERSIFFNPAKLLEDAS
jgi:hypothetical protein